MFASQPAGEDTGSSEVVPTADQRASPRIHAILFVLKIGRAHDAGLFRVKDISDTGLSLTTHGRFAGRERLTIELLPHLLVEGAVAWCDNECCGVELAKPIDCADLLRRRTEQKSIGRARLAASRQPARNVLRFRIPDREKLRDFASFNDLYLHLDQAALK